MNRFIYRNVADRSSPLHKPFRFLYRLSRRIKHVFDLKDMWSWRGENCGKCGSCYRIDYKAKAEVWDPVLPGNVEVCLNCFITKAAQRDIPVTMSDFDWFEVYHK